MTQNHICHKCDDVEKEWKPPKRRCTVDWEDIANKKKCPKGYFTALTIGKSGAEIEAELDRLGYDPQTSPQSPRVGGCCDPPRE